MITAEDMDEMKVKAKLKATKLAAEFRERYSQKRQLLPMKRANRAQMQKLKADKMRDETQGEQSVSPGENIELGV